MIDVKELRIGNTILYNGEITIVVQLDKRTNKTSQINDIVFDNRCVEDFYKPLPLTEQLLRKFNAISYSGYCVLGRYELVYSAIYKFWSVYLRDGQLYLTKVEYVHELQNFIKAMDGEELTLKQ